MIVFALVTILFSKLYTNVQNFNSQKFILHVCTCILQKLWILLKPQPICFSELYIFSKETSNYQILQKMYKNRSPVLTLSHTPLWPKIIIMGSFTSFMHWKYNFWVHCIQITFVPLKMYFFL